MKFRINNNQIKYDTGRAILVKIPWTKYTTWIPQSLAYADKNGWSTTIYVPDGMTFRIMHDKALVEEVSNKDFYDYFQSIHISDKKPHVPVKFTHLPPKLDPVRRDADDSLKR